jgi:hypothetical protein
VCKRGGLEIQLRVSFLRFDRWSSQQLADLFTAGPECFGSVTKGDDPIFDRGTDEHEQAGWETLKGVHVELTHVGRVDSVTECPGQPARRYLGECVEGVAVDEAFLEQADSDGRVANSKVPLEVDDSDRVAQL